MTNELSEDARKLMDRARRQGGPTAARKARLTASVMAAASSAVAMGASAGVTTAAKTTAGSASLLKLVGAGLLASVVGVSGTAAVKYALRAEPAAPPSVVRQATPGRAVPAPLPQPAAMVAAPVTAEPTVVAASPKRTTRPTAPLQPPAAHNPDELGTSVAPAPLAPEDSSAAEVAALASAMEALEAGRFTEALQTSRAARLRYPQGVLRPELALVEIESLCGLKQPADARRLAAEMPRADRSPMVLERLTRTCTGGDQ